MPEEITVPLDELENQEIVVPVNELKAAPRTLATAQPRRGVLSGVAERSKQLGEGALNLLGIDPRAKDIPSVVSGILIRPFIKSSLETAFKTVLTGEIPAQTSEELISRVLEDEEKKKAQF